MMQKYQTKQVAIDGVSYTILAFRASEGLQILKEFTKIIEKCGKNLVPILREISENNDIGNIKLDAHFINDVLDGIFNIFDGDIVSFLKKTVSNTQLEGQMLTSEIFDLAFSCNYLSLLTLAKEVLLFNFFSQIITKAQGIKKNK